MSNDRPHRPAGTAGAPTEPITPPQVASRDETPHEIPLRPGDRIGFYQIEERLGAGGMGVVYRARDTQLGRTVALKLLSSQLGREQDLLTRFRNEAQIQARLTGRHIVTLHTIVQSPSGLALVMEYVEGRTLARQLARHGPLAAGQALRIFDHALRGVAQAHRLGIIHGDLKPGNIFLGRDGEIKLMDFGVAQLIEGPNPAAAHTLFGTLRYMAPEQIEGRRADFRSDFYALGVSLYEAVTGRVPFNTEDPKTLLDAHLCETPPSPSSLVPELPPPLDAIIARGMARLPEQRYQSAEEMRLAIQNLRLELRPGSAPRPRRTIGTAGTGTSRGKLPTGPSAPPFTYVPPRPRGAMARTVGVPAEVTSKRKTARKRLSMLLLALILAVAYFAGFAPDRLVPAEWWARLGGLLR